MAEFESQLAVDDRQRSAIRKEAEALEARRESLAQTLPRSLAAAHRALRARQIPDTVARLEAGVCGACGEPQEIADGDDAPLTCEACDRILIAHPARPAHGNA
jgi:predicted  nucleic acid-binding Zn-ribbon protein